MDKQLARTKTYTKKNTYKRKRQSTKAIVYKAVRQEFRKNAEKKYYQIQYAISLDLAGDIRPIVEPNQGTQNDELIGNKLTLTSLEIGVTLFSPGLATTAPYNQCRVTLLSWKGQNVPTLPDIYQDVTIDYLVLSPFNTQTKKLRKIHFDMVYDQYYVNANGFAVNPLHTVKQVINMANAKGRVNEVWVDNVGYTNQVYLVITANNNGAANTKWSANVCTKANYLDS